MFFSRICEKIKLPTGKLYFYPKKRYWEIHITGGYDSFRKIIELNGITHSKRKNKLIEGFLSALKSTHYKYLEAVSMDVNTSEKVALYLNLSVISTRAYLHKLKKCGFLKGGKYKRYKPIVYKLTKKGEKELKFYQELKNKISDENDNKTTNCGRSRTVRN